MHCRGIINGMDKKLSIKVTGSDTEVLTYYDGAFVLSGGAAILKYTQGHDVLRFILQKDEVRLQKEGELNYELVFRADSRERALIKSDFGIFETYVTAKRLSVRYDDAGAHAEIDYEQDYTDGEIAFYSVKISTV